MRKSITKLFCLLLLTTLTTSAYATIYVATQSNNWSNSTTWGDKGVPSVQTDTVIINGFNVTIDNTMGNITIASLLITNASNAGFAGLTITENVVLTVKGNVDVISENIWKSTELKLTNFAVLNIDTDLKLERTDGNTAWTTLQLLMYNKSMINVAGMFTYNYLDAGSTGFISEVILDNSAILNVAGPTNLYVSGGNDFDFQIRGTAQALLNGGLNMTQDNGKTLTVKTAGDAILQVTGNVVLENGGGTGATALMSGPDGGEILIVGNVELNSTVADQRVQMNAEGDSSKIQVLGDITLDAQSEGDVAINLDLGGELAIGGNFIRVDNNGLFGSLVTNMGGQLVYNGTQKQTIAMENAARSGSDSFNANNVKFENTKGFILEGPFVIHDSLNLVEGIIFTDSVRTITIADGATIKGGSETAFIAGPITKEGSTNGESFIFPTGFVSMDGSLERYAPIEISALGDINDKFTAEYVGCPPPHFDKIKVDDPLDHISSLEYWKLSQSDETVSAVNVTLHWMDETTSGIDNPSSLAIASYDEATTSWSSLGNGGVTINGSQGTLKNDTGCPPPHFDLFTFGSTLPMTNALPVDLLRFTAQKTNNEIKIEWLTNNEEDNDYFVVEHSENGMQFEKVGTVQAAHNGREMQYYSLMDQQPHFGQNYYRLMQMDVDGTYSFSSVITVNWGTVIGEPVIYPNPVADYLNVQGNNPLDTEASVEVFDRGGQLVYAGMVSLQNGNLKMQSRDLNLFVPGNYFLRMSSESGTYTLPLIKVN